MLLADPHRHAELAHQQYRSAGWVDRQDAGAVAAVVDLPDLLLTNAIATAHVDRVFGELRPIVGEHLGLEDMHLIIIAHLLPTPFRNTCSSVALASAKCAGRSARVPRIARICVSKSA